MKTFVTLLAMLCASNATCALADIYQCRDNIGVTHFTTNPNLSEWCSPKLRKEYRIKEIERADKSAAAEKVRLAKGPVRIGMTTQQVLASSWGKPVDVNRTTTAAGTREQWVYGSRQYLYFEGGLLAVIQD